MSTYNRSAMIFDHKDADGDTLSVYTLAARRYAPATLAVAVNAEDDDREQIAHLTPDAVTRLRAALKPHDPAEKGAEAPAQVFEIGRAYRLLPGARYSNGEPASIARAGATRVTYDGPGDGDGNVWVRPVGGGMARLVAPRYLAPLDPPAPAPATTEGASYADLSGEDMDALGLRLVTEESFPLDAQRVAAVKEAFAILGDDGATVDTDSLLAIADFLIGEAA
ncbi:hypothetical protein [Micromonospora sp. NPDC047730]|uniref:hypothetical protein n=1 Tax=Micromonospora sp. NPDC047730 TaxID=3364253 RepID=UPI00370FE197